MKKFKMYLTTGMLCANLLLTSCSSQIASEKESSQQGTLKIAKQSQELLLSAQQAAMKELERAKEEKVAFDKAISNPEFIETEEFQKVNSVSIEWDDVSKEYIIACSSEDATYNINLPEERLISYMLKKCNCEYLFLRGIKNNRILEELSALNSIKELSLYDVDMSDLNAISQYKNLVGLRFENCKNLENITFIKSLSDLEAIEMLGTNVSDISPLNSCLKLRIAKLRCNQITNPETLSSLGNLEMLCLEYNKIENVNQLKSFIEMGVITEGQADLIVETTTNRMLILSIEGEEKTGDSLYINYYESIKGYYAEVKDKDNNVVSYMCTNEPYNFYDISEKLQEKKKLSVSNFPEEGYIHHLSGEEEYQVVVVQNCYFDYFPISNFKNATSIGIYYCPNLINTFQGTPSLGGLKELKYLTVRNSGIANIDGLSALKNLEGVFLENNNIDNYDALKKLKNLQNLVITLDNPDYDYTTLNFDEMDERGVAYKIYIPSNREKENTEEEIPQDRPRAR